MAGLDYTRAQEKHRAGPPSQQGGSIGEVLRNAEAKWRDDMRIRALDFAVRAGSYEGTPSAEDIVTRAQAYYEFLTGVLRAPQA